MNAQDLKKLGLKTTLPRLKILEVLERSEKRHLSVEDVYKYLLAHNQEVSLATIYRVLSQFEKSGMVTKLNFENSQAMFELMPDEHHDHLVCVKCGKIDEFQDDVIEQHQKDIAHQYGYQLTEHCLYLYGICPDCQK